VISYKFARRSFLRGLGAGSAAVMVPLLRSIEARAAGVAAPLRFLVIHHPLGTASGLANWRPNASATTTNFTLPVESAPFAPLQKYMVMVDGVNVVAATSHGSGGISPDTNGGGQNTHEGGMVAIMTGVPTIGMVGQQDHCAGGPSIDQILLQQAPGLGGPAFTKPTPFPSLQLAADIRSDRDEKAPRVLSYLAPKSGVSDPDQARQPQFPDTSPLNVYKRIFGGTLPTGMNTAQLLAQKESVITYMRSDLARLQTLVPASEKDRITAHTDAIAQLEASIQQMYGMTTQTSVCTKPTAPTDYSNTSSGKQGSGSVYSDLGGVDYFVPNQPTSHPHIDLGQTQLRLIKAAFLCDLTRVATFMWSAGTNWVVFPGTFQGATIAGNPQSTPHHPPSHAGDSATNAWLNQIDQLYSASTATILQEFATTPDIDGNMLLDNTVVVYLTEVARAADHNQQNMPLLIFGGKNTKVKGGTYLKVTGGSLSAQTGGSGNRPFNDVWLALAPVFGVTMNSLGAASQYTGPLPGIFS
jgi:uncharacterized protein DUF1552